MSRTGWSTSNFLRLVSPPVTAYPVTMAAWFNTPTAVGARRIIGIYNSTAAGSFNLLQIGLSTATSTVFMLAADGAAGTSTATTATFAVNVWNHVAAVFTSATARAIILNGGGKVTDATSRAITGIDRASIGISDTATPTSPMDAGGLIAEGAIWSAALSDSEVARHASGIAATAIRRGSLVGYWPLNGGGLTEVNVVNRNQDIAVVGALTLSAPPSIVFIPKPAPLIGLLGI